MLALGQRPAALALLLAFGLGWSATASPHPELSLGPGDLRIEQRSDGGYHLFARAKPGMGSVLLTESTQDPAKKVDSFAYRALERNEVNGSELRVLDGKVLSSEGLYFLVDSSPEPDAVFGRAFHIFIPWIVAWGYPWSRSGTEYIHDGSFVNLRCFAKARADYSGPFADNPFVIRVGQKASRASAEASASAASSPEGGAGASPAVAASASAMPVKEAPVETSVAQPVPAAAAAAQPAPGAASGSAGPATPRAAPSASSGSRKAPRLLSTLPASKASLYYPETLKAFSRLAQATGGDLGYASEGGLLAQIDALLSELPPGAMDLVLCVDTTDTMEASIQALKSGLVAMLKKRLADRPGSRLGMVGYKDYFEEYLTKRFDFVAEPSVFGGELASLRSGGGRDVPEAVYEGLYAAAQEFPWSAPLRVILLVGDAPPHPLPRGSVGEAEVLAVARDQGVEICAVAVQK